MDSLRSMRRLRDLRLLAAVLGIALGTANPASVLAHALAHRDGHEAHQHITSLEAHDGPAELSSPGHAGSHQHVRLDQATRTSTHQLLLAKPVTATSADLDLATPKRVGVVPGKAVLHSDPLGEDPPRLRAPPLS